MGTTFRRGQELSRADGLNIFLKANDGTPSNVAEIFYNIYDFTTGVEVLLPPSGRVPLNASVGEYFASFVIPADANLGKYRIRWNFRKNLTSSMVQVLQEFAIIDSAQTQTVNLPGASVIEFDLVRSLRIMLRDANPSRNYHFVPPSGEESINSMNRVFGYLWEDMELLEFLNVSNDTINMYPPMTTYNNLDQLITNQRPWRSLLLTGAMVHAITAIALNWIADEFSLDGEEVVCLKIDDKWSPISIKDFYENVQKNPSLALALRNGELITKSVTALGAIVETPISDVVRHSTAHKKMVRVNTENGLSVCCTEDHSLFELVGGLPVPAHAGSLFPGSKIVLVNADGCAETVVSSVEVLDSQEFTYDLSVPGTENFVLFNGILAHNTYSIGGVSLDIEKSSKYQSMASEAQARFQEYIVPAKQTVLIIRGLKQSRYGVGIRSSFGPSVGRGSLSPRRFLGVLQGEGIKRPQPT